MAVGVEQTGPFWAARAYPPLSGQDHLGLGSVSFDRILPELSPGINVQTVHPRYWSFYAFLLDEFWQRSLPRTRAAFRDFYRPREAMFSFACHVCEQPEHATLRTGIVGAQRVAGLAREAEAFDPYFDYINAALGGYGQYYRSVMEAMRLLVPPDPVAGVRFDAPTARGRGLAGAYRSAIAATAFYREHFDTLDDAVPREVLAGFAAVGCLCQGGPDRLLLQDLFLHAGPEGQPEARRATLRFFLDLAPVAPLNPDRFRRLVYFRSLDGTDYQPLPGTGATARQWRLYQAREYFAYAFNRLWAWLARRGYELSDSGLRTVPADTLWSFIRAEIDSGTFTGCSANTPALTLLEWLTAQVDVASGVDDVWTPHDDLDEGALQQWCHNGIDDADTLVAMLAILLLIYQRIGIPQRQADLMADAWILTQGDTGRIAMSWFFGRLHERLSEGATIGDLLCWILHDFVLVQHERVAHAKLPDDTFRFRRVADSVRFLTDDAAAGFSDSRFNALSTVVHELGFVSRLSADKRTLTAVGERLRHDGDLPAGALEQAAAAFTSKSDA
jgi:hypothetical protein